VLIFDLVQDQFGSYIAVSRSELLRSPYCSHLECRSELLRYPYFHSFGMDQARLVYHLFSGAFAGIWDVRRMLGELILSDRGVRSLALLRVCLLIHLLVCLPSLDSVHLSSFFIVDL